MFQLCLEQCQTKYSATSLLTNMAINRDIFFFFQISKNYKYNLKSESHVELFFGKLIKARIISP